MDCKIPKFQPWMGKLTIPRKRKLYSNESRQVENFIMLRK
jgi:hypothetical protein